MTAPATPRPVTPFPAVDHCYYDDGAFTVVKRVTAADPYAGGRYPGVFVLETLVQAARLALGAPDLVPASAEATGLRGLPAGAMLIVRPTIVATEDGCDVTADGIALRCVRASATAPPRRPRPPSQAGTTATMPPDRVPPDVLPPDSGSRDAEPLDTAALGVVLLDAVTRHVPGVGVTAHRVIRADEPCYRDCGADAYPATLVLASFAGACAALLALEGRPPAEPSALRGVVVRGAAHPGQTLVHSAALRPDGWISGETRVDGRPVLTVDGLRPGEASTG